MTVENLRDFLRDAGVPPGVPDARAWVEEIAVICEKQEVWHAQVARARHSVLMSSSREPLVAVARGIGRAGCGKDGRLVSGQTALPGGRTLAR